MAGNSERISTRHFFISSRFSSRRFFFVACLLISLMTFAGCGGGKGNDNSNPPANVGGGFTLVASGGTLNDGSGVNGLAALVTLRDSSGSGPGAAGWRIKITGNGINTPQVSYDDGSQGSYITWWWSGLNPVSGTYTATASNGATTLTYNFSIDASKNLSQPVLNKATNTISWSPITGAGSYYYRVADGTGFLVTSGYLAADQLVSSYSFTLPNLTDGSYRIEVFAQTTNRVALQNDTSAWPSLASQENMALGAIDLVQGGGYTLNAKGGVLYEGSLYSAGTGTKDYYGLVIWTSILTAPTNSALSPTPPASDWNIIVTGPSITTQIAFTYPGTDSHYIDWDFGTVPAAGTYTVSATVSGGTTTLSQTFTIPSPTSKLPVATGLTATPVNGGGANASWSQVTGATSYYVNLWTCAGAGSVNTPSGCTNGGTYTEIAGSWVSTPSAVIPGKTLTPGLVYDVYVTACQLDMTNMKSAPPPVPGAQVNMSDTTFTYATITAQ